MSSERLRDPAPLQDKAAVDLHEVSAEEHRPASDAHVKEQTVQRLERAMPPGPGAAMEPNKVSWWMVALPVVSFIVALGIAVWILSSAGGALMAILLGLGFVLLSNAPLIGAIWMRQRDKRHVEHAVDDEARRIDSRTYGTAGASGTTR